MASATDSVHMLVTPIYVYVRNDSTLQCGHVGIDSNGIGPYIIYAATVHTALHTALRPGMCWSAVDIHLRKGRPAGLARPRVVHAIYQGRGRFGEWASGTPPMPGPWPHGGGCMLASGPTWQA